MPGTVKTTVEFHIGTFLGRHGTISETWLGRLHNKEFSFSGQVSIDFDDGSGQEFNPQIAPDDLGEISQYLACLHQIAGVDEWEKLPGRRLIALYAPSDASGYIKGLASLDGRRYFVRLSPASVATHHDEPEQ